jgi:hypothetical protein
MGVGGQRHGRFTLGKDPIPIVQEAGWAPGPVWTGAENPPPPPAFDSPTVEPVASRYTDSYPGPMKSIDIMGNFYKHCVRIMWLQ